MLRRRANAPEPVQPTQEVTRVRVYPFCGNLWFIWGRPLMAGQIVKRGDKVYLVRVPLGQDPATGTRRYVNRTIHGTKREAEQLLTALLRSRDTGTLIEPTAQTLGSYLDHWLEAAAKPRLRPRTFEEYMKQLERYVRPKLGLLKLNKVTPLAIQALYREMLERGLSARTVRLTHAILRNALKQAVRWQLLPFNPADAVDLPRQQRREMRAMTEDEVDRFVEASDHSDWHILFMLLLTTGLRPSEAIALKWQDVDLANAQLRVQRTVKRVKGKWCFEPTKTKRSNRSIDLPSGTVALLANLPMDDELVFHRNGEPIHIRKIIENHFKPTLKRAGLPQTIRFYDLRHTHATLLLRADEHPKKVAERLGHSTITLTMDTYSHVTPTMQRETAAKLDALVFGCTPEPKPKKHGPKEKPLN